MKKNNNEPQILIVGAGLSGLVLAERYASLGKKVLIIEKRAHLGGNCFDFYNQDGILVSLYGAHLFHTNYEDVWQYLQKFSKWRAYEHKVRAWVDMQLVPVPVNIETVNRLLKLNISTESEMEDWLSKNQVKYNKPANSEEMALSRVGKYLYEKIFKNYTFKQWQKYPAELEPLVTGRIPVRTNFEDRYFSDKYQAQPINGYTQMFEKMIDSPLIELRLNCDFFEFKRDKILSKFEKIFYTGPIDKFFDYNVEGKKLEYRSLEFKFSTHDQEFYQDHAVINYPNEYKFTRIVEYKHITGQIHSKTTISKEYPTNIGEPYYPVPTANNRLLYSKYKEQTKHFKNVYFIGRLAEYRYINMDEAVKRSLELFKKIENI